MAVPQAIQRGKALPEYGVEWLEELLPVPDRAGLVEFTGGYLHIPSGPGWGTDLNEAVARKYAWQGKPSFALR